MTASATDSDGLRSAFDAFNQQSSRLQDSYRELRDQVDVLTRQLKHAQSARERELVEKERLSNRLLRTVEALPGAVIVLDGNGIVRERNGKATELLNRPLLRLAWSDIVRRECTPNAASNGDLCLNDGRCLSLSRQSLGDEPGEILLLADVTESRRMAELLQRSERLSCLGEMTAGLAHQIRTPLASALLNAARIVGDHEQEMLAARIRDRLNEVGRMIDDMLRFTSGARRSNEKFPVAELFAELVDTCESNLAGTDLTVALLRDDIEVAGNRDAIKGALSNLVDNARQSCGADAYIELGAEFCKDRICLTVTDNGHGVPSDIRGRLFEPFFTTRPQGTGLGLAVVRAVVEAHGGEVLLHSGATGSTFALCLPANGGEK